MSKTITLFSPAKLNLFLAIAGRRADGFHDLVSVVAPLEFGDRLRVREAEAGFELECDEPEVPVDGRNLVLKAAAAFREASGWRGGARFWLEKRVPMGAGLGGGSSNAAAALRALNTLAGEPLGESELVEVAGRVGSDCALFLYEEPVVMRGRGEKVERLSETGSKRLRGRRVLVFKPAFGISTAWAYQRMAAGAPGTYMGAEEAEGRLRAWEGERGGEARPTLAAAEELLFNNMEAVAFAKFPALPVLSERLEMEFGLKPRMSGSGSACFALLGDDAPVAAISHRIREAWGVSGFLVETRLR